MITQSDIIVLILAIAIGYLDDIIGPQPYHYENKIVIVDKKYQCPSYCGVNHSHSVYFQGAVRNPMIMEIDKSKLGKKFKEKKVKKR